MKHHSVWRTGAKSGTTGRHKDCKNAERVYSRCTKEGGEYRYTQQIEAICQGTISEEKNPPARFPISCLLI